MQKLELRTQSVGLKAEYINGRTAARLEAKNTRKKND